MYRWCCINFQHQEEDIIKASAVDNRHQQIIANSRVAKKPITKAESVANLPKHIITKKQQPWKTLSSILSALTKAACGIATTKPKDPVIVNIDEFDKNNELAEVEYVEDIYTFYKLSENEQGRLRDYMDSQPDINARMRTLLLHWLIKVHSKYGLMPETLYRSINIVDRYLSLTTVACTDLLLIGTSALLISSKYEEISPPSVTDMIDLSNSAYSREQILAMEKAILSRLGWYLTVPTPYEFAVRYTKASLPFDKQMEDMVFFFTELGLIDYWVTTRNNPSKLAASAVYAARCTLNKTPAWTETLKHYTGYCEDELRDCAKTLVHFHTCKSKLKAVYRKYAKAALSPPAMSLLV